MKHFVLALVEVLEELTELGADEVAGRQVADPYPQGGDLATRDFIRSELREFLEDLDERQEEELRRDETDEVV